MTTVCVTVKKAPVYKNSELLMVEDEVGRPGNSLGTQPPALALLIESVAVSMVLQSTVWKSVLFVFLTTFSGETFTLGTSAL